MTEQRVVKNVGSLKNQQGMLQRLRQTMGSHLASAYDTRPLLLRASADLLMANLGLFLGYVVTLTYHVLLKGNLSQEWVANAFWKGWLGSIPLFTAVCLGTFCVSGLYSRAPGFRPLYKLWVSFRAVGLAFLLHMALIYLMRERFPRSAALAGWVFVMVMIAGVRAGRNIFFMRYNVEPRRGARGGKTHHVLLIGGAGYIGSVLSRMLLDEGYCVRVLDRFLYGKNSIQELRGRTGFEVQEGDFRSLESCSRALRGMDAVVHLGAIVGDPACALDEDFAVDVNTNAVRMIGAIGRGYGIRRLLFASTCSVYGAQQGVIDERSELAPVSLYAKSKIDAEKALMDLADPNFHPTILRLATVFGLSHRMRFDLVVNLLSARAVEEGKITIFNGHQWRPFIHVKDVARAFLTCLKAPLPLVSGNVFSAGDTRLNCTLGQLGAIVAEAVPGTQVVEENNSDDKRSYRVDFSKIGDKLGFAASVSLKDGIEEIVAALRDGNFESYDDPRYSNIGSLKSLLDDAGLAKAVMGARCQASASTETGT